MKICVEQDITKKEIEVVIKHYDTSIIISYPDGNIFRSIMAVYGVELLSKPKLICSKESIELRFFSLMELQNIKLVETHIPILRDYLTSMNCPNDHMS